MKNPDDVDAGVGKGGALVSLGVNYEARPLLERLSREYPKRMEPRLNLAWMDLFSSFQPSRRHAQCACARSAVPG